MDQIKCLRFKKMVEEMRRQRIQSKGAGKGTVKLVQMSLNILQTNLGKGRAAHDLAYATAKQMNIDIMIVSEPNKNIVKGSEWIKDERVDVAVMFVNKKVIMTHVDLGVGYVCFSLVNCDFYCCYISPNISLDKYMESVHVVVSSVVARGREAIAGDANAKSPHWGSPFSNERGDYWMDWAAALDLVVHNTGKTPTFVRGGSESYIDVTFSTQKLAKLIVHWEVIEQENLTDHRYIYYGLKVDTAPGKILDKRSLCSSLELMTCTMTNEEKVSHMQSNKYLMRTM